jgi:hypothetical protein
MGAIKFGDNTTQASAFTDDDKTAVGTIGTLTTGLATAISTIASLTTAMENMQTSLTKATPFVVANYRLTTLEMTGYTMQGVNTWLTIDKITNINHDIPLPLGQYMVTMEAKVGNQQGQINEISKAVSRIEYYDLATNTLVHSTYTQGFDITYDTFQRNIVSYNIVDYYTVPPNVILRIRIRTWGRVKSNPGTVYTADIKVVRMLDTSLAPSAQP